VEEIDLSSVAMSMVIVLFMDFISWDIVHFLITSTNDKREKENF